MRGGCPSPPGACSFAHSKEELRSVDLALKASRGLIPSATKHKSVICQKWFSTGACAYASRCTFLHPIDVSLLVVDDARAAAAAAHCGVGSPLSPSSNKLRVRAGGGFVGGAGSPPPPASAELEAPLHPVILDLFARAASAGLRTVAAPPMRCFGAEDADDWAPELSWER